MVGGATVAMYVLLVGMVKGASVTISRQRSQSARLLRELGRVQTQQELDRVKAEFISAISHELRTPLGIVKGFATTLLRDDIEVDTETRREFLQIIDDESDKLQRMIDELLDTSRLQAGKLEMDRRPVVLNEMIEVAMHKLEPALNQRGHDLHTELVGDEIAVNVDRMRIEQALHNLLDNAARYSEPGSPIQVEATSDQAGYGKEQPGSPFSHGVQGSGHPGLRPRRGRRSGRHSE